MHTLIPISTSPTASGVTALQGSRSNALKHGLTATTLLPDVLGAESLQRHHQAVLAEWQPQTPTEKILVAELARHAAALELTETLEAAVLRSGARAAVLLTSTIDADAMTAEAHDMILTGAASSEALDRLTRYRRSHEKALHQTLQRLRELQPALGTSSPRVEPPFAFDKQHCTEYLCTRMKDSSWRCPRCGRAKGYWLPSRQRWQCAGCAGQVGLRTGTVMERSPLPLASWFAAIWAMLQDPEIALLELAAVTGITREATLRNIRDRIAKALKSCDPSVQLAGLDRRLAAQASPRGGRRADN